MEKVNMSTEIDNKVRVNEKKTGGFLKGFIFIVLFIVLFILFVVCCSPIFSGCSGLGLVNKIPEGEFTLFEYHRGGNVTSAHITAKNAIKDGETVVIESVTIDANYGPAVDFVIKLEGYKRPINTVVVAE